MTGSRLAASLNTLRAVFWGLRARRRAKHIVWVEGIGGARRLPAAPAIPTELSRVVAAVLIRTRATCLVQSLVLQRWFADHGEPIDVVIGVTAPSDGFHAHAWLDRPGELGTDGFTELHRLSPSAS